MSEKINAVIQRLRTNDEERKYFFRVAPEYPNLHLWLMPLCDEEYFNPDNKNIHETIFFLEAVAKQNQDKPQEDVADKLLKIVNSYIGFRNSGDEKTGNYYIDWFMLKIAFLLPHHLLSLEHIEFIRKSISEYDGVIDGELGKTFIPHLLIHNLKEHILLLIDIIFDHGQDEIPLIKDYWLKDILEKHAKNLAKCIGIEGYKKLLQIMKNQLEKQQKSFSIFEVNAVERRDDTLFYSNRHDRYIVYFIGDILENLSKEELEPIIHNLLAMEHQIFKRLALHILNDKYEILKDIFWSWFATIKDVADIGKHELYVLFEKRAHAFSDDEMDRVIVWIENLKLNYDEDEEKKIYFEAYRKKEWLTALKEHSGKALELYEKYNTVNPSEIEHPGFDYYMSEGWVGHESPISFERLEQMNALEIASFIKKDFIPADYRTKRIWSDDDAMEGLADALSTKATEYPNKFLTDIDEFLDLDHKYVYHILHGFYNALKNNKSLDWEKIFAFVEKLLDSGFFDSEHPQGNWSAGTIAELIDTGIKHISDDILLQRAKQILMTLLTKSKNENIQDFSDIVTTTINTTKGKIFESLISYSLHTIKLKAADKQAWDEDIKQLFSEKINNQSEQDLLFFATLGMYLQNLLYLDKEWVFSNFDKIFPLDNEQIWKASIESYLYIGGSVYEVIYQRFNNGGHIDKIISSYSSSEDLVERIVQHVCVAFMNDFDDKKIFEILNLSYETTENIIDFIWGTYRENKSSIILNKVFVLWKIIYEKYNFSRDEEEAKLIFSKLSKWFVFIDKIDDDNLMMLQQCAKEANYEHNDYFLIDELLRLSDNYPAECADIFLARTENLPVPDYPKEDIIKLVDIFFANNNSRTKANEIHAKYAKSGNFILRDVKTIQ